MASEVSLLTPRVKRALDTAYAIDQEVGRPSDAWSYSSPVWIQTLLPHRDPQAGGRDVPFFSRTDGLRAMVITPGAWQARNGTVQTGYPFGVLPRLLFMWLSEKARTSDSRELEVDLTLHEFLRQFDLSTGGGDRRRLMEQLQRLLSATLHVTQAEQPNSPAQSLGARVSEKWNLWTTPSDLDQRGMLPSSITLSAPFYDLLREHSFPVDTRQVAALRVSGGGSLSLDIYCWLAYRLHSLARPTQVSWDQLQQQFASDYERARDFRRDFKKALMPVLAVYPAADVELVEEWDGPGRGHQLRGGLVLRRSRAPIGRRSA